MVGVVKEAVQKGFAGEEATIHEPLLEYQARRTLGAYIRAKGLSK